MTITDDLDRILRVHYRATADRSVPPGQLDRIMAATLPVSQRAAWQATVRRTTFGGGHVPFLLTRRMAAGLVVLLLVLALAVIVASRPRQPYGRGLLAFTRGGDLLVADQDGHGAVTVLSGGGLTIDDPRWSTDGRWLMVSGVGTAPVILDRDGFKPQQLDVPFSVWAWSPVGATLAVVTSGETRGPRLVLIDVAAGTSRELVRPFDAQALAWSPDGRRLAAAVANILTVVDVDTGGTTVVVGRDDGHAGATDPSWSPDSRRLVFTHLDCTTPREGCSKALAVVDLDGTAVQDLTSYGGWSPQASWSPAGGWIAYGFDIKNPTDANGEPVGDFPGLALIRPDGSGGQVMAEQPVARWAWDPDGAGLTYAAVDSPAQAPYPLWRRIVSTGLTESIGVSADAFAWQPVDPGTRRVTVPPAAVAAPGSEGRPVVETPAPALPASPDSGALAWFRDCAMSVHDFALGTERTTITSPGCNDGASVSISPDGRRLVANGSTVSVIGPEGQVVIEEHRAGDAFWNWSEDGHWLVEHTCVRNGQTCEGTYMIERPDGTGRRQLPGGPMWSPNGRRLAIWVVDPAEPDTVTERELLVGAGDGSALTSIGRFPPTTWAPDGERFAFVRGGNVWSAEADGTDIRQVSRFEFGGVDALVWAPDGRRLAVSRGRAIWIVPADGGEARQLDLPQVGFASPIWSPDGTRLAVTATLEGESFDPTLNRLYIVDVDGPRIVLLRGLDSPAWSPDGHFLAVQATTGPFSSQAIEIVNADGTGPRTMTDSDTFAGWWGWLRSE